MRVCRVLCSACNGNEDSIAKLKGAERGDLFADRQSAVDHNLIAEHGAALDLTALGSRPAVFVCDNDEHLVSPRSLAQGADRDGKDCLR